MQPSPPRNLVLIAALQVVTVLLLPPRLWGGIGPAILLAVAALFGLLGVALYRLRAWGRLATIFVQGLNIIVRLLVLLGNVAPAQGGLDVWLLGLSLVSMALSALILIQIDKPEIQMVMQ
ncbi:MAG: hypothetical protein GX657_07130 [Chloroflexi bacterium]|jgi:hypothetical protein|nr:hypothetical protein [Chloroflexota bacterium]